MARWLAAMVVCGCSAKQPEAPDAGLGRIEHVVVLLQENHSFDNYFGLWCTGDGGTPCSGRSCCERAPAQVPGRDDTTSQPSTCAAYPPYLDDAYDNSGDPTHKADYEYEEMDLADGGGGFRLDNYSCHNVRYALAEDPAFAYPDVASATPAYPLRTYHNLAASGALADRYFQPIVGASSSNDMFFARAGFVFQDNQRALPFAGYTDATLGDLLDAHGVNWAVYMGGLAAGCGPGESYPFCVDLTDNPFAFSKGYAATRDLAQFEQDLTDGTLPAFSLLRALGSDSEHPEDDGNAGDITGGQNRFIKPALDALNASSAWRTTLVLITWDEGGGFYDHVPPPLALADGCALPVTRLSSHTGLCGLIDASHVPDGGVVPQTTDDPEYYSNAAHMNGQEYYGTRLALIALGPFARRGVVSHVQLEHSSIVKFVEWNFLDGGTGQLHARDAHVNNLGSLLAPELGVPEGL